MSKSKKISGSRRDLTQVSLAGNLFHLAVPMMASMGLNSLYNIVDAFHTAPVASAPTLRLDSWL